MNMQTKQQGVVLVIGLLMLLLLTIIGVSAMRTAANTERTAGNNQAATISFQAAESAVKNLFTIQGVSPTVMAPYTATQTNNYDVDLENIGSATISVQATGTVLFCGEDPVATGTSFCSGPQDPNCRQTFAFDVTGTSQIAGTGARENHLKRGARIGPNLDLTFNGPRTSTSCLAL